MAPDWWDLPRINDNSRWLGYKDGQLCVWKVVWSDWEGEREHAQLINYLLCQEETGEFKRIKAGKMQELIAAKRLILIYDYTKEQWVQMSK